MPKLTIRVEVDTKCFVREHTLRITLNIQNQVWMGKSMGQELLTTGRVSDICRKVSHMLVLFVTAYIRASTATADAGHF